MIAVEQRVLHDGKYSLLPLQHWVENSLFYVR